MEDPHNPPMPPPFKKRKFIRKRTDYDGQELPENIGTPTSTPTPTSAELLTLDEMISCNSDASISHTPKASDSPLSVAELLRQRKAMQRKKGGIGFVNGSSATGVILQEPRDQSPATEENGALSKFVTVADRFAPQTGQVADVDQHMMAYIDSELAKRRQQQMKTSQASNPDSTGGSSANNTIDAAVKKQPAALGKLHEIDLGPDATLTNIARTEEAKRRLADGTPEIVQQVGKIRLGRDGKPRRPRKRRNSDDVKRDKLVEEVMKESKLDIYDEPEVQFPNDDQSNDDRIAEQFRREFLDAVSQRNQKKPQTAKKPGPGGVDDNQKGPKLGGSRSARAAMRELQEKAKKK